MMETTATNTPTSRRGEGSQADGVGGEDSDAILGLELLRVVMAIRGEVDAGAFLAWAHAEAGLPPLPSRETPPWRGPLPLAPDDSPPSLFPADDWVRDGYCRIGPTLGKTGLDRLDLGAAATMEAAFQQSGMGDRTMWRTLVTQIPEPARWDAAFYLLERNANILYAAAASLHCERVACAWSHLVLKPPGIDRDLPWHTDRPTWPLPPGVEGVAVWVPLDAVGADSGGLRYRPGSHRSIDPLPPVVDPGWFGPGEALLHHADVLHASPPNHSGAWRRAWIGVFVNVD